MPRDLDYVLDEPVADFHARDTFLSQTDARGVIEFGNETFVRLSGYSREELIGAPQKIIRHPDMPKAVFRLFWDNLKAGLPFCAYIKNLAKEGHHYWVVAVAAPVPSGYLSVRFKPSSDEFEKIQNLYAKLLKAEAEEGLKPGDGAKRIDAASVEMGFRDYRDFMGYMLAKELRARNLALGREADESVIQFERIGDQLAKLADGVSEIKELFKSVSNSPVNLSVISSKLSKGREPMQVLASNYTHLIEELVKAINGLEVRLGPVNDSAIEGRVQHCSSVLYREALEACQNADESTDQDMRRTEESVLRTALTDFDRASRASCGEIEREVENFSNLMERLKKLLSGLAMSRIVCQIEAASLVEFTESISAISERLEKFQDALAKSLGDIASVCRLMSANLPQHIAR